MANYMDSKETPAALRSPGSQDSSTVPIAEHFEDDVHPVVYKVYKRRFIGLFQLFLLNVVASWDVSFLLFHLSSALPNVS